MYCEIGDLDFNRVRNTIVEIAILSFITRKKKNKGKEFVVYISIWNVGQPEI